MASAGGGVGGVGALTGSPGAEGSFAVAGADEDPASVFAASGVVANEKQKQAEEARLEAAKVAAQTKQIEAATFANPALLEIKKLELQLEIERARSEGIKSHQGPLTIMYGQPGVQLQVPAQR